MEKKNILLICGGIAASLLLGYGIYRLTKGEADLLDPTIKQLYLGKCH